MQMHCRVVLENCISLLAIITLNGRMFTLPFCTDNPLCWACPRLNYVTVYQCNCFTCKLLGNQFQLLHGSLQEVVGTKVRFMDWLAWLRQFYVSWLMFPRYWISRVNYLDVWQYFSVPCPAYPALWRFSQQSDTCIYSDIAQRNVRAFTWNYRRKCKTWLTSRYLSDKDEGNVNFEILNYQLLLQYYRWKRLLIVSLLSSVVYNCSRQYKDNLKRIKTNSH